MKGLKKFGLPVQEDRGKLKLVIMTNDQSYEEIIQFYKENDYFGYKSVYFFPQVTNYIYFYNSNAPPKETSKRLPAVDTEGKILLKGKKEICFTPNGNGIIWP